MTSVEHGCGTHVAMDPSCTSAEQPARDGPVNAGEWLQAKIVGGRTMELVDQA